MKDGIAIGMVCVDLGTRGTISWEPPSDFKQLIETGGPQIQAEIQEAFEPALKMFLLSLAGISLSGEALAEEGLKSLMRRMAEFNEDQIVLLRAAMANRDQSKNPQLMN